MWPVPMWFGVCWNWLNMEGGRLFCDSLIVIAGIANVDLVEICDSKARQHRIGLFF